MKKILERRDWCVSGVFIANFEEVNNYVMVTFVFPFI